MNKSPHENITNKVYEKIKSDDVKMRPSCIFLFRSWLWLALAGLFFVAATILVSFDTHYVASLQPFDLIFEKPLLLLSALPYILIALTVLFIFFAAKSYRMSRSCCRHENWMLLATIVFGAAVIGSSIYYAHLEHKMRLALEESNFYQNMVVTPKEFWNRPEQGTLSGVISSEIDTRGNVTLTGWDGTKWMIVREENANISNCIFEKQTSVKMVGKQNQRCECGNS